MPDGGQIAYEWLGEAMDHYEKAEAIRPTDNCVALIRRNTCARFIMRHHLKPANEKHVEHPLE